MTVLERDVKQKSPKRMDISKLTKTELTAFLLDNPHLLDQMQEEDLIKIQETVNPYAQVAAGDNKYAVVSITNFKAEYWRAFKTLSMLKFLAQITTESADWASQAGIPEEEHKQFAKHLEAFRKHFLTYDKEKDCRDSRHREGQDDVQTPSQDFFHRWQRYEDQNSEKLHKDVQGVYNYRSKYQAAVQVFNVFDTEKEAQSFVQENSITLGVDMLIGQTNKWLIVQDNEDFLEKTYYTDDEDQLLTGLIEQMRKDSRLGEDMIKKRLDQKRQESVAKNGEVPEEAKAFIDNKNRIYKNNRLELAELPEGEAVNVPIILSGPEGITKQMI